jgi:hypothetical protein
MTEYLAIGVVNNFLIKRIFTYFLEQGKMMDCLATVDILRLLGKEDTYRLFGK